MLPKEDLRRFRVFGTDMFDATSEPDRDADYELGQFDDANEARLCAETAVAEPQVADQDFCDRVRILDREQGTIIFDRTCSPSIP